MRKFLLLIALAVSAVNAIAAEYWEQVTSMDQLKSGDVITLVAESATGTASKVQYTSPRAVITSFGTNDLLLLSECTIADGNFDVAPYELTMVANGSNWNFVNAEGNHLVAKQGKNNAYFDAAGTAGSNFNVSIYDSANAFNGSININYVISASETRVLQFNPNFTSGWTLGSARIAFYKPTSNMKPVFAYRKVNDTQTGIDGIAVDGNAKAEYFTLQGTRVEGDTLAPGFYVRRQGGKTAKIMVR